MTDDEILARHRRASSMHPNGRPESHAERRLREATSLIHALLYGHDYAPEQQRIRDMAAEFLRDTNQ